ncbi:MAG: hypothetical protein ACI4CS_09795, partial [Candidatus Weimeria sp.]
MAGTPEAGMQETMRLTKAWAEIIEKILNYFARREENREKNAGMRELAKRVREGHGVNFPIQGEGIADMVKAEFLRNGIAKFDTGRTSVLIDDADLDKAREIQRRCLIAKSNYYQVVGYEEMENAIAGNPKIHDKGVTEIKDLSFYEMECLKHKCNDISKGFTVGVREKEDGRYDLIIRSNKLYEKNPVKTDFCEASARFIMSLYGPNSEIKTKQIEDDAKTDALIADLKNDGKEHWLVSADNPNRYVHFYPLLDEEGNVKKSMFEYKEFYPGRDKNGKAVMLERQMNAMGSDGADYE